MRARNEMDVINDAQVAHVVRTLVDAYVREKSFRNRPQVRTGQRDFFFNFSLFGIA